MPSGPLVRAVVVGSWAPHVCARPPSSSRSTNASDFSYRDGLANLHAAIEIHRCGRFGIGRKQWRMPPRLTSAFQPAITTGDCVALLAAWIGSGALPCPLLRFTLVMASSLLQVLAGYAGRASRDGHQFQRPASATTAGTIKVRATKVSMSTPAATAKPSWRRSCRGRRSRTTSAAWRSLSSCTSASTPGSATRRCAITPSSRRAAAARTPVG